VAVHKPRWLARRVGIHRRHLGLLDHQFGSLESGPQGRRIGRQKLRLVSLHNRAAVGPIAVAGTDQSVHTGDLVTLDGSASWDQEGDPLSFSWTFDSRPSSSTATLQDPTSVHPTFTADSAGTYIIGLVVSDGLLYSMSDTVSVSTINVAPVADAGPDQSVYLGDFVILDGSGSWDPDGDAVTFAWVFTSIPMDSIAELQYADSAQPEFTADIVGTYVVQLVVNDGSEDSQPDTVEVSTVNVRPVADTGPDKAVFVGDTVCLDGSGSSDPDEDPLSFNWAFTSVPDGSLATLDDPAAVNPSLLLTSQASTL